MNSDFGIIEDVIMKSSARSLRSKITYMNLVLTIIAVLLALQLAHNVGLLTATNVHANTVMPVQIEAVRGVVPVAIKEPVSNYPPSVCVSPCR